VDNIELRFPPPLFLNTVRTRRDNLKYNLSLSFTASSSTLGLYW